jgi:putative phosphoesterase
MRLALLADVHGNLHALEAVLEEARAARPDAIWVAGDWVGYGAFPEECVARLRELGAIGIRGDMDDEVLAAAAGELPSRAAEEKKAALRFAAAAMSEESRRWLAELPTRRRLEAGSLAALLVHGSPAAHQEHLWPDTPEERLRELARFAAVDVVVCGHTHAAMDRRADGALFVNPGSVGRPGDGDPRAAWGLLVVGDDRAVGWQPHRTGYDHEAAARAIRDAGMPELVARMVRQGRGLKQLRSERQS